jgi:predicted adenylyl cyclase CyaB
MPSNIEIKARLADPEATRRLAAQVADGPPTLVEQADTFFLVPEGRLKLRELGGGRAELIYYRRADTPDPVASDYERVAVSDAPALAALLASALGLAGTVRKRRLLYRAGRTRIHLDEVERLGHFLELEVEMGPGESPQDGIRDADLLMAKLSIPRDALVADAYVDLLAATSQDPSTA